MVLGVLVLLWLGQSWWRSRQANQSSGWTKLESGAKAEQVDKIKLEVKGKAWEFKKADNTWMLDQKKANVSKIQTLLDLLNGPAVELVSQNKDRYAELGVDDSANKLSFYKGDEDKFSLLVEKNAGQLVRQKDKQNVYKLSNGLELTDNNNDWLEATPSASLSPTPGKK